MEQSLNVGIIGGLGLMASPMAIHWKGIELIKVLYVHDRGTKNQKKDDFRKRWIDYGTKLVKSIKEIASDEVDGVFICCGKNGDDLPIIKEVVNCLKSTPNKKKFICHMSTVSTDFVKSAREYCNRNNLIYANYPLTGGSVGAEKGTLLILASGDKELYELLKPALTKLGTPKYFGERVEASCEVKLIGQIMVFNGLIGICSAITAYANCFEEGRIGSSKQIEFFDFLNSGAGGTKQWDLIVRNTLTSNNWEEPFLLKYAAVDAIYTIDLCIKKTLPVLSIQPLALAALSFSFVLNKYGLTLATPSILREMLRNNKDELDNFFIKHLGNANDSTLVVARVIDSLPPSVRNSVIVDVNLKDFCL